jgi:hypothetical protein
VALETPLSCIPPNQPTQGFGFQMGPLPAHPVLCLLFLLRAVSGVWLAPGCERAAWGRRLPVLLDELRLGRPSQGTQLPAVHLYPEQAEGLHLWSSGGRSRIGWGPQISGLLRQMSASDRATFQALTRPLPNGWPLWVPCSPSPAATAVISTPSTPPFSARQCPHRLAAWSAFCSLPRFPAWPACGQRALRSTCPPPLL